MTERKPAGMSFESWIDAQIREATERGEFKDLPGKGKPIKDLDSHDELWWVRQKLARENVEVVPPYFQLRKAIEQLPDALAGLRDEASVREALGDLNQRIRTHNRLPTDGPPSTLMPLDVEEWVARWRSAAR